MMNKIFFTADTHFGSERTLELSKRPFSSVEEMNWEMVKRWNTTVSEGDTVYHLGDFGSPAYFHLLNGNILMVRGNYDSDYVMDLLKEDGAGEISKGHLFPLNGLKFWLVHKPVDADDKAKFYLFGHVHKLRMVMTNGLNVGVDCHDFKPIDVETVMFYRNAIENHYDENVFM